MRALLLLVFFVSTYNTVFAQKLKEETDPFTGKTVKSIWAQLSDEVCQFKFFRTENTYSMKLYMKLNGALQRKYTTSDTLYLALENGKVLKLAPTEDCTPRINPSQYGATTVFEPTIPMTSDQVNDLASSRIKAAKFSNFNTSEWFIMKYNYNRIQKAAAKIAGIEN